MPIVALVAAAVVIVAAIASVTVLALDDGSEPSAMPAAVSSSPAEPSTEPTPSRDAESEQVISSDEPSPDASGLGDVREQPAGLFCRDLFADGYSYSAAVTYWQGNGQPNQMDEDRNGIPCQTVYPPSDVSDYWGSVPVPDVALSGLETLPPGLFCRDLRAQGYDYGEALAYWWSQGSPEQMDADLNGIPCETVYPTSEVDLYWYG